MLDKQFVLNYYIRTELDTGNQVSDTSENRDRTASINLLTADINDRQWLLDESMSQRT
jgi:hypothetical protein